MNRTPPRSAVATLCALSLLLVVSLAVVLVSQSVGQVRRSARVSLTASDLTAAGAHLVQPGGSRGRHASSKGVHQASAHDVHLLNDLATASKTLRFAVCNGFANQRLSIVYGILIAAKTRRVPVLPSLIADGRQFVDLGPGAQTQGGVGFDSYYDEAFFLRSMMDSVSMRVLPDSAAPPLSEYKRVSIAELGPDLLEGLRAHEGTNHVAIDCPLFALPPGAIEAEGEHIWAVLDALRPAPVIQAVVDVMIRQISRLSPVAGGAFNFLHLRVEEDWVRHCQQWEAIQDGIVRDNCLRNTDTIDVMLGLFRLRKTAPLFVASYWADVDRTSPHVQGLSRIVQAGFQLLSEEDVFEADELRKFKSLHRDVRALIHFHVGMEAERYLGNSVSTFSALAILERRHRGQWAAYYNGGNVPVTGYLPSLMQLPWVFTHNSASEQYDAMLKAAVRSAARFGSLKPYCVFSGDNSSAIHRWLVQQNVTVITHEAAWRDEFIAKAKAAGATKNVRHSHLYATPEMMVSTFMRVDLPVIPELDQYTYILYTDTDVYFRRPVTLDSLGLPLPRSVALSYEMVNSFPYNAGILVAHLPEMRQRYKAFMKMMMDTDDPGNDAFYYVNYGPGDQGIINKFYEADIRARMLDQAFNAKPYNAFDGNSYIVHFHGPKPFDYLQFLTSNTCRFGDMCELGVTHAFCTYAKEWAQYLPEDAGALALGGSCDWLTKPHLKLIFAQKWGIQAGLTDG